jgi:hypothetical protein
MVSTNMVIYNNSRSNHFRFHSKTVTAEQAKTVMNKINVADNNSKNSNSKVDTKQEGRTWSYL